MKILISAYISIFIYKLCRFVAMDIEMLVVSFNSCCCFSLTGSTSLWLWKCVQCKKRPKVYERMDENGYGASIFPSSYSIQSRPTQCVLISFHQATSCKQPNSSFNGWITQPIAIITWRRIPGEDSIGLTYWPQFGGVIDHTCKVEQNSPTMSGHPTPHWPSAVSSAFSSLR